MRFSPRTWSLLSLALFAGAILFWLKGNEVEARKRKAAPPSTQTNSPGHVASIDLLSPNATGVPLAQLSSAPKRSSEVTDDQIDRMYPERLRNTGRSLRELMRQDHAILLANALIDTDAADPLNIPEQFRAQADPGSYIVQWNGAPNGEFRTRLAEAGAQIVSYVPNNAYLVKVSAAGAKQIEGMRGIQAVLPFEPYYKVQRPLLVAAVNGELLAPDALLRVTLLPGTRESALAAVQTLGVQVLAEEGSPFGPQFVVKPPVDALSALARLPEVQGIEQQSRHKLASDLSRIVLGVATNGTATNYQNLSGSNVWVNINDTGIDTTHASLNGVTTLLPAPPIPMAGDDPEGHGTFVASLIAGSGNNSPTNIPGSLTNSLFRGIAPASKLIALPLAAGGGSDDFPILNEIVRDSWLIETAARTNYLALRRTNTLISNNSWTYGQRGYDSSAARFDAAVRDAIPGLTGSQPLLFVFAAGNSGFGNDEGTSGQVDSIESPGTAKNVITVGALESYRLITNIFVTSTNIEVDEFTGLTNEIVTTNYPFAAQTDSSNQVAAFSSRGNVGIGIEGASGRFKPDVVAPGTMLVGARSAGWDFFGLNTNDESFGTGVFNLHTNIQEYRLDSGTTYAAANVSGLLALLQEYFEAVAPTGARGPLSPALAKAILVNSSRSLTELYDLATRKSDNLQGWGLPYLPNMLSSYSTNTHASLDQKKWRLRTVEQSATNALSSGQEVTWNVTLSSNAVTYPLRVTLVWTDPPGNPAVGVKLVNDLDLIVTNLDTDVPTVFYGNDIPTEADFNDPVVPNDTFVPPFDVINNVENVAIGNPKQFGRRFSVTVRARRVNVNAVPDYLATTGRTNDVVQDFALVISSDVGSDPGANDAETYVPSLDVFETFEAVPRITTTSTNITIAVLTNGLPLIAERVGANPTLILTNGERSQWNFYVFTNSTISNNFVQVEAGTNVAFVTFDPPNLGRPRNIDADIDIYVSTNPQITNLNPAVLNAATTYRATERGGTEAVILTNGIVDAIYYVAVKSEDQQAAEFSLIGVSSAAPFERDDGRIRLIGVPVSAYLPDGSARTPVAGTMLAIGVSNRRVARITAQTQLFHENYGDLVGVLSHNRINSILNNHRIYQPLPLRTNLFFDDNTFASSVLPSRPAERSHSDGPGSLNDFAGSRIAGAWLLQMIDNAPSHTGRVEYLELQIDPLRDPLLSGQFFSGILGANETAFFPIEVGPGVTNLTFTVTNQAPLIAYFRQLALPETNVYDIRTNIINPGGKFAFPTTNSAPLQPGTHYLALQNPGATPNKFAVRVDFGFGLKPGDVFNFTGAAPRPSDAATTNSTVTVPNDKVVARAQVSVHVDHPRVSDLALTLISPQGTRVLLDENRGGANIAFGGTQIVTNSVGVGTNISYTIFSDDTNVAQLPIKFAMPFILQNLTNIGVVSSNGFETAPITTYFDGETIEGQWRGVGFLDVVGDGAFSGRRAVELSGNGAGAESGIAQDINTQAGRVYKVTFSSRTPGRDYLYWTERSGALTNSGTNFLRRVALTGADTNIQTLLTTNGVTGAFGGVAVDPINGNLFSGDRRFLFRTDLQGGGRTNLVATQNVVTDVEVDPANSWVYWAESGPFTRTNSIKRARFNGTGVQVLFQALNGEVNGIALDAAQNKLYFTLSLNTFVDMIQSIDLGTRQRRIERFLSDANSNPFDIDFDPATQTFIYNQLGDRSFWRLTRSGAVARQYTATFATVNGFAFDSAAKTLYFNAFTNGSGTIYSRDFSASTLTPAVRARQAVYYEDIARSVVGASGSAPLVAEISFGLTTNYVFASSDWQTNTFYFVGRGRSERVNILAREGFLRLDDVMVERVGDTFVQPEEPLSSIIGQRSIGDWRLEVQDTRTGAFLPAGSLDWKLDLNFADPVIFAETLTGGSTFSISTGSTVNPRNRFTPGILRTNDVHYFVVQPCAGARNLTILLNGIRNFNSIDLLADTSGIPTGNADTDDFVLMRNNENPPSRNGVLEFRLSNLLPAPAHLAGKPVYLALRNSFQDVTNIYSLTVASDGNCTPLPQPFTTLAAGQGEVGALASASSYSAAQMGLHAMNIPSGAQSVTLTVEADQDVSILAQRDEPPTVESFSHSQNNPGSGNEQLTITRDSGMPLTPGRWFVRVVNNADRPTDYTITATGDLTDEPSVLSVQAEVADGQLRLNWDGAEGASSELQSSNDLTNWITVQDFEDGTSSYIVEDINGIARFYRVLRK